MPQVFAAVARVCVCVNRVTPGRNPFQTLHFCASTLSGLKSYTRTHTQAALGLPEEPNLYQGKQQTNVVREGMRLYREQRHGKSSTDATADY